MAAALNNRSFTQLAVLHLPPQSRLLASACSPEKDLAVLVYRQANKDKLCLWRLQGSKKWEVDVEKGEVSREEIVGLAWSPDGQTILVAHHPPRLSIHSVEDGREERTLPVTHNYGSNPPGAFRITGVWWIKDDEHPDDIEFPDLFQRGIDKPGSAHSILKSMLLLDPLQDDTQPVNSVDTFAFHGQGGQPARSKTKSSLPQSIASWPALPPDLISSSIAPSLRPGGTGPAQVKDPHEHPNYDTFVVVGDSLGYIHVFLDGTYPLGAVTLGDNREPTSVLKSPIDPVLYVQTVRASESPTDSSVELSATPTVLPLLQKPCLRDVARISSSARELTWYVMRVIEEMREAWRGGARDIGPKFVEQLEENMRSHQAPGGAIFDLTTTLLTGRASESLGDMFAGGGKMGERGIEKWKTTMTDTLLKLRDYSEKRILPASQRLIILLEELRGYAYLPKDYASFELIPSEIKYCLLLAKRLVESAVWLAATAREELMRFTEFIAWLRHEFVKYSTSDREPIRPSRADIGEVNAYFENGLQSSEIDHWFVKGLASVAPSDIRAAPPPSRILADTITLARQTLDPPTTLPGATPPVNPSVDTDPPISHLDRSLPDLVQEFASHCSVIFERAAGATGRTATLGQTWGLLELPEALVPSEESYARTDSFVLRERMMLDEDSDGPLSQFIAVRLPGKTNEPAHLCLIQFRYPHEDISSPPVSMGATLFECRVLDNREDQMEDDEGILTDVDLLDLQFFDHETLALVLRTRVTPARAFLATMLYRDLEYHRLEVGHEGVQTSRLYLAGDVLRRFEIGELTSVLLPIARSRELTIGKTGGVSLAVNGQRKVGCVLDGVRSEVEILDMNEDEEEGSEDEDMGE